MFSSSSPPLARTCTVYLKVSWFLDEVLKEVRKGKDGRYKNIDATTKARAKEILNEIRRNQLQNITGNLVQIDLLERAIDIRPWK